MSEQPSVELRTPRAWYAVMPERRLAPGQLEAFIVGGVPRVVWRTEGGRVQVGDARCPHLGGRLDRSGRVFAEQLECTLHGYRFGLDGRPAGRRAGACPLHRPLAVHPVATRHGMIFTWFDEAGAEPTYELPLGPRGDGWSPWEHTCFDAETSPQVIMRDLADAGHYETIHRYGNVRTVDGPRFDGHVLRLSVEFDWDTGLPGRAGRLPARFQSECHGLGYQYTETQSMGGRYHTRHLVLPTPLGGGRCRVHVATATRTVGRVAAVLNRGPAAAVARRFGHAMFLRDIGRDRRLWEALPPWPGDTRALDADMEAYRAWASRFTSPVDPRPEVAHG